MSRIVISLSGEGRGHAARTLTLLEMLCDRHECTVLAPSTVLEMIRPHLKKHGSVRLRALPHLQFHYGLRGRLSYAKSWMAAAPFIVRLGSHVRSLIDDLQQERPDLAITDFEPVLPRAALAMHLPLISLDHQHFLSAIDTRLLPLGLRWKALFLRPSIELFCPVADLHLVSSFFRYKQRVGTDGIRQVGVLLRNELGRIPSQAGQHLLVYVRRGQSMKWLRPLSQCGLPVRVYGMTCSEERHERIEFREISATRFIEDLATCRALITTAGNQLVGEALALAKPVLAIPEPGNFEQQLNGYFLQQSGMGRCLQASQFDEKRLRDFLDDLDRLRERAAAFDRVGNEEVLNAIRSRLPQEKSDVEILGSRKQGLCA